MHQCVTSDQSFLLDLAIIGKLKDIEWLARRLFDAPMCNLRTIFDIRSEKLCNAVNAPMCNFGSKTNFGFG